jgi:ribosomal protein L21E
MIQKLRTNLAQSQARIKKYADLKRTERQFKVGDMVYVKQQPFGQSAFSIHQSLNLSTKFYGPSRVLEKIGVVANKL